MKRSNFFACLILACFGTLAGATQTFVPVAGVMEFSGRMIVRPKQIPDLLKSGDSFGYAMRRHQLAGSYLSQSALQYVAATDEYVITVPRGMTENQVAVQLMATGAYQYVEPDWIVYPQDTVPNDPSFNLQWHLPKIQAPAAWDLFRGNNTITVAITDTGVRTDHEDLQALLVPGYNAASDLTQVNGGAVDDINGHGTHCAGIAAAAGNNAKGVSGVGWNLRIMPVRVTNSTSGNASISALTAGARWAADNGARVISTSYSGVSSSSVQTTGSYIKNQRNGIYCWAAGNSNTNLSTFDHADVTIVGATDSNDAKASFSSYGLATDVYAPGVNIFATLRDSTSAYGYKSGTSMATPCVAGVAAVIMATNPVLTGQDVETALYQACDDLGPTGNDTQWGWGRVNVNRGVRYSYEHFPFLADTMVPETQTAPAGTPEQLAASDDVYVYLSNPVSRLGHMGVELTATTTLLAVGTLTFSVESHTNTATYLQKIELFDFTVGEWDTVDVSAPSLVDGTVTVSPANPSRFVQPGTGVMRAMLQYDRFQRGGPIGEISLDAVSWKTTP